MVTYIPQAARLRVVAVFLPSQRKAGGQDSTQTSSVSTLPRAAPSSRKTWNGGNLTRQHAPAAHHLASLSYPATVTCPTTTPFLTGELDLPAGGGKQRDLAGTACPTGSHVGTLMAWTWEWVERLMGGDLRCLRPHARIIYLACRAHACVWDKSKPPVKKFSIDRVFLVHCHPPCSMPFWRLRLRWGSDRGARTWGQRWKGGTAVGALKQRGGPKLHDVLLSPPG